MKNLECSSKGDKRFSAFYAKVSVFGKYDSIENHYQMCKRSVINGVVSISGKGKKVDYMVIGDREFEIKYLTSYYILLWIKYLDNNVELVEYAGEFDTFSDMFKGKSINCQADVIRRYIEDGREVLMEECKEFIGLLK